MILLYFKDTKKHGFFITIETMLFNLRLNICKD